jgi:hypothetical protein
LFRDLKSQVVDLGRCIERWRNVPWQTASLVNGFTSVGGSYAPVAYYRDFVGRVYLRGRLNVPESASAGVTMFTLAADYRPAYTHEFRTPEFANATVQASGAVKLSSFSLAEQVPLDVVQFRTT